MTFAPLSGLFSSHVVADRFESHADRASIISRRPTRFSPNPTISRDCLHGHEAAEDARRERRQRLPRRSLEPSRRGAAKQTSSDMWGFGAAIRPDFMRSDGRERRVELAQCTRDEGPCGIKTRIGDRISGLKIVRTVFNENKIIISIQFLGGVRDQPLGMRRTGHLGSGVRNRLGSAVDLRF